MRYFVYYTHRTVQRNIRIFSSRLTVKSPSAHSRLRCEIQEEIPFQKTCHKAISLDTRDGNILSDIVTLTVVVGVSEGFSTPSHIKYYIYVVQRYQCAVLLNSRGTYSTNKYIFRNEGYYYYTINITVKNLRFFFPPSVLNIFLRGPI